MLSPPVTATGATLWPGESSASRETRETDSAAEPGLGEWLSRRWLYGLAYWQALLIATLGVALILTRFFALGDRAMHHDESMHAKFAWDTFQGQVYKYNPLLHGPFQFLAVATSFWLFGATEWTARGVPAVFGVALVGLTFLWRRWLGATGWLLAVAILVFSPSFTYFSRMLREDSYTATWTLLAATGLVGYVLGADALRPSSSRSDSPPGGERPPDGRTASPHQRRRRAWYYAFCVGLAFAFATKESTYITAFIFGTFMIFSLLWERTGTTGRRMLAGAATGAIVGAFWSSVMGHYKRELFEVGGAVLGLLLGGVLGLAYDRWQRVRSRRARPALLSLSTGNGQPVPAARATTFTSALTTLWKDGDGFWGIGTLWGGVIVFFAIFVVLFSSLFTNFPGIREGMIGSITYWLEQHGVQRGNQPWFYYLLILGVYETIALVFGLLATAYYLSRPTWLTMFLVWWWVLALVIYSWAGEKMPWLIIHIALPMVLLSARYLGELATAPTRRPNDGPGAGATGAFGAGGDHWAAGGLSGGTLPRGVWEKRLAFALFAVLGIWTVHTGWPVNFERPDTPRDLLVYTQSAPDVKKVMADIERLSLEQTADARGLGVVVQSGTWWPFSWYMRDFKNAEYPAQLTAPATKPVVLIAAEDDDKNRPFLQGYTRTRYKMRWWYPEDYRTIPDQAREAGGLLPFLARPDVRTGLWRWLIYRETTQPLGSYDFYVYVKEGLTPTVAQASSSSGAQPGLPGQQVGQSGQAGQVSGQPAQVGGVVGQVGQVGEPPVSAARADGQQYLARAVTIVPVAQWGSNGRAPNQLNTPRGLALDGQGNVYVTDSLNHRVQKFDRSGRLIASWGSEGSGDGQFKEPMGVAADAQGNVFVADTWNHRIQKFDASGKFVAKWAGQGGGFWGPRGIGVDGQGNVFVTDTGNKRIQKFDNGGRFLAQLGAPGSGPGQLNEPIGLAVTADGELYVADTNNRRIQKFNAEGRPVAEWPVAGWQNGARNEPYLAVDPEGNVYATDPGGARLLKFSPTGEVLAVGGAFGRQPGQFELPLGIAVGDAVYVADSGNHRIQSIAPLPTSE
ncbi:MAG: TIGR03663 family protein [Chloroflexota bacterium]|nr:TIGR03663 family protein [Chloroflexota bacterium]